MCLILILVFGGAYNGKLSFVKEKFNISDEEVLTLNNIYYLEIDFSKKVINKFQNLTYKISL